jgi:hypothetical protein
MVLLAFAFVALVAGLGLTALSRVRRRRGLQPQVGAAPPASRLGNASPTRSAVPATSAGNANGLRPSHAAAALSPNGIASPLEADVSSSAAAVPPDVHRTWIASIEWGETDAESRFCVSARAAEGGPATVIANSDPLEWPPAGPAAVRALSGAVAKLEASLVAAGWRALPRGSEWYAKRFSWEPVVAPPTGSTPGQRPGSSRFARRPPWPEDTTELWGCEIEWDAAPVSRLRAAVYRPGDRLGRAIGVSATLESPSNGAPDPQDPACRTQVRALAAALEAAGWEQAGRGGDWFAERFVWRGDGVPPDRLTGLGIAGRRVR